MSQSVTSSTKPNTNLFSSNYPSRETPSRRPTRRHPLPPPPLLLPSCPSSSSSPLSSSSSSSPPSSSSSPLPPPRLPHGDPPPPRPPARPASSSPPRSAWKYAWASPRAAAPSPRLAPTPAAVTARLSQPAPSRESLQAAAAAAAASLAASKPPPNRRSAALAARRFDAGAPAGGNYGEALYREAAALAARREAWAEGERCRQAEEEGRQCTFAPRVGGGKAAAAGGGGDEAFTARFERMQLEQQERKAALAELVREEAARECTFKPHVAVTKNKLSEQLTAGYGNVLDEMSKRDEARERRQQELKSKLEEDARKNLTHKPTLHRPHSASSPSPSAAEPAYERLYMQRTASHASDYSPSAIDPECTFHPNKSAAAEAWGEGAVVRSRAHLEEVGEALYKDAHNRRLRRQMMAEQMAAELNELRNIPKMSKRSNELALQKLRKDVLDIYSLLNAEQTGISYQELGAALVELGLLRWIGPPPDTNASSAAREDTLMLQRVWRALTRAEGREAAEARLPSAVLIDFMMAALSPERQVEEREEPKAREECATPSPRREEGEEEEGGGGSGGGGSGEGGGGGGEEDGGEGEEADGAGEGGGGRREEAGEGAAPPKPWGDDASLLSDFAALYRNTHSYKSTRNVREATEVELARSQAECTFNPAIDARSRRLEAFRQAAEAPRHERLYETARQIEARLEEMRRRHEAAALEGCSFRPAVNKPPPYIRANLQQSSGELPSELGSLPELRALYAFGTRLSGTLPASLATATSLRYLYLAGNRLSGTLPPSLASLLALRELDAASNALSGTLPAALARRRLDHLGLEANPGLAGWVAPRVGRGCAGGEEKHLRGQQRRGEAAPP